MPVEPRNVPLSLTHKVARLALAFGIGLGLSFYAFQRATDPEPAMQRAKEEAAVLAARDLLRTYLDSSAELEIVDPVSPNRKIGKSYIYPADAGWELSGHYRRSEADRWHPFLMTIDPRHDLVSLSVKDDPRNFSAGAMRDSKLTISK